jgi:type II secretory pathway component GspD/PulD (secretin)
LTTLLKDMQTILPSPKARVPQSISRFQRGTRHGAAWLLLAIFPGVSLAQSIAVNTEAPAASTVTVKPPRASDQRRAAKLFLTASKLFTAEKFEESLRDYEKAAHLDPGNNDYALAAEVARGHAATALVQAAAKARLHGDAAAARASLARALALDPKNPLIGQHLSELGNDALQGQFQPIYEQADNSIGDWEHLSPMPGVHSFHLHMDQRQIVRQIFKAYGIEVAIDQSVRASQVKLDVEDASFAEAVRLLELTTQTFHVALDAHRVLIARDTRENRQQFMRQEMETVYLSGLSTQELTDVGNLAKNVFDMQQASVEPSASTLTLRAPQRTLNSFNETLRKLIDGRNQVLLQVHILQLAHTNTRNTGVEFPQQITAVNVYAEEQSILNANQSLVQQIISSGLASANDPLTIIALLIASGEVTSSLFSNGFALFGGGITQSALSWGSTTVNLNLNSSDTRQLDQVQLRLGDGEEGSVRSGTKYPIQTSSYSSLSSSSSSIAGLTSAGSSSSLSSLLASYSNGSNAPQVEYQDLGLTLKATPKVMRNNDVVLTLDMKIDGLSGSSLNGNPELDNRAYSGVVTIRQGEAVMVASELSKSQSRALSGTPGLSDIPGLGNLTGNDTEKNYSTLLIVITPQVVRSTQVPGHSVAMRVERGTQGR